VAEVVSVLVTTLLLPTMDVVFVTVVHDPTVKLPVCSKLNPVAVAGQESTTELLKCVMASFGRLITWKGEL
jgi:hypothetical protein